MPRNRKQQQTTRGTLAGAAERNGRIEDEEDRKIEKQDDQPDQFKRVRCEYLRVLHHDNNIKNHLFGSFAMRTLRICVHNFYNSLLYDYFSSPLFLLLTCFISFFFCFSDRINHDNFSLDNFSWS